MPVNLLCERCGRSMGSFAWDKVRDFVQEHGETCKDCLKREEKLIKFFEMQKGAYIKKMDGLLNESKIELAKEVRRLGEDAFDGSGE